MESSSAKAGQDLHLPISSSTMYSIPYQGAIVKLDFTHFNNTNYINTIVTAVSTGYDMSRVDDDVLSSFSHVPFGLDNHSDLDDVVNLDDLVSSDSEWPSPPVAARTSLSQSFIAGPARHPRTSLRKMSTCSSRPASAHRETVMVNKMAPTVARMTSSQVGKRKARTRTVKRKELVIVRMKWVTVRSEDLPPDPRYDCGLAIHGNVVIVVGGIVGKLRLNDLHTLDLAAKPSPRWAQPPISGTPPPSGHLLQIFVLGDDLYAIGGTIDGKFLTELHRLNVQEWKWDKLEVAGNPPSMRYWYSLAVLQGMASTGVTGILSDLAIRLRFDLTQKFRHGWSCGLEVISRDLPQRILLFAFEIEDATKEGIDCVWRKIETQGDGPASRYTHSGVSVGSRIIVYGGNNGCLKGDAYVLDLGTVEAMPTWKLVKCDPPLTPRSWHRAVA
ncbi:unnamed protein product [Peronospora farinosa]|uniref:Uncharacterized protein n=1 Tax=Peronospora farinosa TaxID=134698 RepID=A0ABN8C170_9STRA|nr:unnamed protein product [Peronospora farinosa]